MGVKWIHKGGTSRPDKRTLKKGNKKRWEDLTGISGRLFSQVG